jgi:hypothetical protein
VKRAYIADYLDKDGRTVVVTVPAIKVIIIKLLATGCTRSMAVRRGKY